ncbi:electron transfer flavoprotein subunit alpha/FixB family protein [Thermocrispum municipale]|uniref:electron transfer flavoprotein subunit alpha/FixB family protein n=1 Tax=Thermocrispum municipale TaxID=37926 RepID=UPI00048DA1DD|nr:electron transfer flavoprotein subunit alpha/FixB family protein [Thermocrispum municipale]
MLILAVKVDEHPAWADAVGVARGLTDDVHAVVFDASAVDELPKQGIRVAHVVEHEVLGDYAPEAYGEALAQLVKQVQPSAVVAPGSEKGNEVLAHLAARAGLPLAANCTQVGGTGRPWQLTRIRGGGMLLEDAELDASCGLFTVQPGAGPSNGTAPVDAVDVHRFTPELAAELARTRVVDRAEREAGVSLATAEVVVSGGRGVGSADGYKTLEELAELLGGAVGCSRVATNNGWRPHSDQVGLTGTKIAPKLYIACGISGATQHWVGCMDAKAILAVNTDPEAPMMTRSTYSVVGDLHEVLPAVIDEIRARGRVDQASG